MPTDIVSVGNASVPVVNCSLIVFWDLSRAYFGGVVVQKNEKRQVDNVACFKEEKNEVKSTSADNE